MHKQHTYFQFKPLMLAVILLLTGACQKEDTVAYFVDEPLREYFDRFMVEAALRNITIDLEALEVTGSMRVISTPQVIGQCIHSELEPNTVVIDKLYWTNATDSEREFLVFHELGHCALNRGHLDLSDGTGDCLSIMTSGTGICRVNYTLANRQALLDELFTP